MTTWQVDFYHRPLRDASGKPVWELAVCSLDQNFKTHAFCAQSDANSDWLAEQFKAIATATHHFPDQIQVFRPQAVGLVEVACQRLGITLVPTRKTPELKDYLKERFNQYQQLDYYTREPYDPVHLEQPPPTPMPENLWGETWQFAAIAAVDLNPFFHDLPIPIRDIPDGLRPIDLKLPSTVPVPGVVITAGRQSMRLARWIDDIRPVALNYIPGDPDGLILEAGLVERWILVTFNDPDVQQAAQVFQSRLQQTDGLHFLLIQPDASGITYSGFWLLKSAS